MSDTGWNVGKKTKKKDFHKIESAVIIGLVTKQQTQEKLDEYLNELEFLAETAGAKCVKRFTQKMDHPNKRFYVGTGKMEEIKEYIEDKKIDMAIFDDDLSGKQVNILEEEFKVKIIDRSTLILDIFASRAQTAQATTQVELAQMLYLLPRLRGLWTHLERQRGGIGMRGPGEKEIETDRRIVRDKISKLKKRLEKIDLQSQTRRKSRGDMIKVALVGYTNAGKSTLMNVLTKSDVFAENKLFATLDTTVRKMVLGAMPFLITDTVGFIRKLPHHLIESFKSTLDEVKDADVLLHVIDISHDQHEDQIETVTKTLKDLDALEKPTIMILNKIDKYRVEKYDEYLDDEIKIQIENDIQSRLKDHFGIETLFLSAKSKYNLDILRSKLQVLVADMYEKRFPYKSKYW